jgi:predicted transcriptional regulator
MNTTAKDVMTSDVVRVTEDMEVRAVAQLFGNEAITGAPVTDEEGHVVGVISQSDLLAHTLTPSPEALPATTVKDIMTPVAVTVEEETPLAEVAARMAQHGIHRVVVVDHTQQVQGIVTSMDIVWWVAAQA